MYLRGVSLQSRFSDFTINQYYRLNHVLLAALTGLFFAVIMFAGLIFGYNYIFSARVFYGVILNNTDFGGKTYDELLVALQKKAAIATSKEFSILSTNQKIKLEQLGIKFNVSKTAETLLNQSKETSNYLAPFKLLINPIRLNWVLDVNRLILTDQLNLLAKDLITSPVNASFELKDNELVINQGKMGTGINLEQTVNSIADSLSADQILPSEIKVYTSLVEADLTGQELIVVLETVSNIIYDNLSLFENQENRTWDFDQAEILGWLEIKSNIFGEATVQYSEATIRKSLEKITKEVNRNAKPTLVSALDNSIIDQGIAGKVVDVDQAVKDITSELSERSQKEPVDNKVELLVIASESAIQKVYPDTTPGLYEGKYVEIDLSSQNLYQYYGNDLLGTYKISTGKWSTPTPIGSFAINNKTPRAYSKQYGLYMPYWMAFLGSKYGLHELPEWPDGKKEGLNHLGTPVSHGCVRLGPGDAGKIYEWTDVGTPVVVHS